MSGGKNQKIQKLIFIILLCILIIDIPVKSNIKINEPAQAGNTSEQFRLERDGTRFIMVYLNQTQTWFVNCTAVYTGKFYLFLYDSRPTSKNFNDDGSIDINSLIRDSTHYNITPSLIKSPNSNSTVYSTSLEYTASQEQLYYLQIVCAEGGPDTYIINSPGIEIQPYYIPFINAYPFGVLIAISIVGIIKLIKNVRKSRRK